jgi:hypothetical protein
MKERIIQRQLENKAKAKAYYDSLTVEQKEARNEKARARYKAKKEAMEQAKIQKAADDIKRANHREYVKQIRKGMTPKEKEAIRIQKAAYYNRNKDSIKEKRLSKLK